MKCELCFDDYLDLPSLTQIQGNNTWIHGNMGYVILESMIWFDLIWLDIPNLTENNIHYGEYSFYYTDDLQATSTFLFHFHFHTVDADELRDFVILHSKYNSQFTSFHFTSFQFTYFSWLICCHNFHDHWSLFGDYLHHHLQEHSNHHWMKWYVVLEDLEWEMRNENENE